MWFIFNLAEKLFWKIDSYCFIVESLRQGIINNFK